jgi:SRP-independent targeting protein 2/TMEM208
VDAGADLTQGLCEVATDVVLLIAFTHLGALVTARAWYALLLVPGAGVYYAAKMLPVLKSALGSGAGKAGAEREGGNGRAVPRKGERDAKQKMRRQQGGR